MDLEELRREVRRVAVEVAALQRRVAEVEEGQRTGYRPVDPARPGEEGG